MKVTYTKEQRQAAIQTYRKTKSYAKTMRILGYPSRHVLFDWVKGVKHGRPKKETPAASHFYSFEIKKQAVTMMLGGIEKNEIARQLDIYCPQQIYKWARIWRQEGDEGLMSKREKGLTKKRITRKQLLDSLPEDREELRQLTVQVMAEKAILEKEHELLKKSRASSRKNCQ